MITLVPERIEDAFIELTTTGADGTATFSLDETATRRTLVIAPTAPRTLLPANYSLTVSAP